MADHAAWFKLRCDASDDPDLDNLPIADFGRYCKLGTHAKAHGTGGVIRLAPPSRALVAKMQVADWWEMILAISRFPGVFLSDAPVTWPHGLEKPPRCGGRILSSGGVATPEMAVYLERHEPVTVFITFRNWRKIQGDMRPGRTKAAGVWRGVQEETRGEVGTEVLVRSTSPPPPREVNPPRSTEGPTPRPPPSKPVGTSPARGDGGASRDVGPGATISSQIEGPPVEARNRPQTADEVCGFPTRRSGYYRPEGFVQIAAGAEMDSIFGEPPKDYPIRPDGEGDR